MAERWKCSSCSSHSLQLCLFAKRLYGLVCRGAEAVIASCLQRLCTEDKHMTLLLIRHGSQKSSKGNTLRFMVAEEKTFNMKTF